MPPKGASTGRKRKVVKTVRAVRKTPPSKAFPDPAEDIASPETPAAPVAEISPSATPVYAAKAAAADATSAPAAVDSGLSPPKTTPQAAAAPAAAAVEVAPPEPTPEATPITGAATEEAAEVVDEASDVAVSEPAEAPQPAAKRMGKKVVTKIRKVTRRVPVKRPRTAAATGNEGKGGDGEERQETVPMATEEQEGNPSSGAGSQGTVPMTTAEQEGNPSSGEGSQGTEPMAVAEQERNANSIEERQETEPMATMEQEGNPSNGGERHESEPMATIEQEVNPTGAEAAVSISAEKIEAASNPDQPAAPANTTSNVEADVSAPTTVASADGASPAALPRKRVRKVKVKVIKKVVKKVRAAQKEEKMEEAEVGTTSEKLSSRDSDVNADELSEAKDLTVDVGASTAFNGAPQMLMHENAIPESGELYSGNGRTGEHVEGEQGKKEAGTSSAGAGDVLPGETERQKRRKTEIFIGGLDKDAKEDDIRKVFGKVGEIVEIRLMMDGKTGKNKGFAFLRYATADQAKQAVKEFTKVEICGKQCGAAALEGNDTIFLGNIDKNWKKDDVIKLLNEIGIEKIDSVTIMPDPKKADCNRGFAFLELETNRDAQIAFKKLQRKDAFGKGQNIKVAWAEPLNDPDEEEMQKVKSIYAEGIPSSWDEKKVRECFKKFGQIERVVLSRNMQSAKRKDFAFVNFTNREAALSCIESFDRDLTDENSKVNLKVSLAKPVPKGKQSKVGSKSGNKDSSNEKPKAVQRDTKAAVSLNKTQSFKGPHGTVGVNNTSTNRELLHVLREQASWRQGQPRYPTGTANPAYRLVSPGGKRPLSALRDDPLYSDPRGYPRARLDSAYPVASTSYSSLSHNMSSASLPHYQQQNVRYGAGSIYGAADASRTFQMRPGTAPHGNSLYPR